MADIPWPICALCKRPVERMTSLPFITCAAVRVVAECHGKRESTVITFEELRNSYNTPLAVAFLQPMIEVTKALVDAVVEPPR